MKKERHKEIKIHWGGGRRGWGRGGMDI